MSEKASRWRVYEPTANERPLFFALETEVFGEASWGQKALEGTLSGGGRALVVKSHNDQALAGMVLWRPVVDEAELLLIGVSPKARRKGVGHALLHTLKADLTAKSITLLHLEVRSENTGAIDFYKQQGFAITGQRPKYYADGSDAVLMNLRLA